MQDGACESDAEVARIAAKIPSFAKKYTVDPCTHAEFMFPTGRTGKWMFYYLLDALHSIKEATDSGTYIKITTLIISLVSFSLL